jgi:hypothetical protein
MNPEGSFLPGITSFAITPAMNPMMIVQIITHSLLPDLRYQRNCCVINP